MVMMSDSDKLRLCGVLKNRVFIGPKTVSIHLTNICNLSCLYCWYHSPLKNKESGTTYQEAKEIDYKVYKKIIDDCRELKVERIQFSAQGEPSLHSRFIDIVNYAKENGFILSLNSNGTFTKAILRHLHKIDEICIDFSAPDALLYRELQSHTKKDFFDSVINSLTYFSKLKDKKIPYIKINYILNSKNYKALSKFFKLMTRFKVDFLNILNVDHYEQTSILSLKKYMLTELNSIIMKEILKNQAK